MFIVEQSNLETPGVSEWLEQIYGRGFVEVLCREVKCVCGHGCGHVVTP